MIAPKEIVTTTMKKTRRDAADRTPRGPWVYSARRPLLLPQRKWIGAVPSAVWGVAIKPE